MRNTIIVLAASVAMGLGMTQMSTDALARSGMQSSGSSHAVSAPSGSAGMRGPSMTSSIRSPSMGGTNRPYVGGSNVVGTNRTFASPSRVTSGTWNRWNGGWRHRHHRFRHFAFVAPFAGYAAYDSCYVPRRVWTPWGWEWRRVYVCDDPYYYSGY